MDHQIDIEALISAVENRPVLWDKTTETYKNKQLNFTAWKEICMILHESFDTLSDKEKNDFGKAVIKKWSNARDNWMRCSKKLKEYKSGSEAKQITKYKFYEQMQFLNKIVNHRPTETNMPSAETDEETAVKYDCSVPKKRKKTEVKEHSLDKRINSLLESSEKEDNSRIMCFFKGIAPTIETFCEADIVNFQYEVIKAMRNIQQKNMPQHSLQPQRNYYENSNSMITNYSENTLNESRQYETLHVRGPFSQIAEYSLGSSSIDSQHSSVSQNDNIDFDFAKSPGSYQ